MTNNENQPVALAATDEIWTRYGALHQDEDGQWVRHDGTPLTFDQVESLGLDGTGRI